MTVAFPRAEPVSEALYVVTTVVGVFGLEGKWVTLWAKGGQREFLATAEVREVSARVMMFADGLHVMCCFLNLSLDYFAGGDRLRA